MTSVNINWAFIGSFVAALGGIVGTIITPIYGQGLTTEVQAILQALSALLISIPTWHVASTVAVNSQATKLAQIEEARDVRKAAIEKDRMTLAHTLGSAA